MLDAIFPLTARDLTRFLRCSHATALDLQQRAIGEGARKDPAAWDRDCAATLKALQAGPEALTGAALQSGLWGGRAARLIRVARPSALGAYSYEVASPPLSKLPTPEAVLELVLLSDLLAAVQGAAPQAAHLDLESEGGVALRLADYAHYGREARSRLEGFLAAPAPTRPIPCASCAQCRFAADCRADWQATDSLFKLGSIARGQVKRLERAGVTTLAALAALDSPVRGLSEATRQRLATQARLHQSSGSGTPVYELRPSEPGKGFDLLAEPQPGDLFYALTGPLHGLLSETAFRAFGAGQGAAAATTQEEGQLLRGLLAALRETLEAAPNARIYHFGPAPLTALRRLTADQGRGEAFLDRLLRERRFIDLQAVVRGSVIGSQSSHSVHALQGYYAAPGVEAASDATPVCSDAGPDADADVGSETARSECRRLVALRDWLIGLRPAGPWPEPAPEASAKESEEAAEAEALRAALAASALPVERQEMLYNLGMFHRREMKPAQWAVFESLAKDGEALLDSLDALAGLQASGPVGPIKRSFARSYRFPPQETKLSAGRKATVAVADGPPVSVSIEALDRRAREITLKVGPGKAHLLAEELSLHPDWPLDPKPIPGALRDVIEDQMGAKRYRAVDDLLSRAAPRLVGVGLAEGGDPLVATLAAVSAMDETLLLIQGPPGTGKTYVTARAILQLLRQGARVGVASNSHEAIRNVLMGCLAAMEDPEEFDLLHKTSGEDDGYPSGCRVRRSTSNDEAAAAPHLVGATAWFFTRAENIQAFDWLFVDEAGQVGLANMAAMGRAARNIVLVGDPRQLPQVIQGTHPEPANLSCFDWMLGEAATVPADRGIFLPISRRMHPAVCAYISAQVYGGRLTSHPDAARQVLSGSPFPEAGAYWVPVAHEGNTQIASEEVAAIGAAVTGLLEGTWTEKDGRRRRLEAADIIVVAPYNAQVNALRDALPAAIRVGTVDKFQGQEAPVCLVSMTASSAEDSARGMEFLFSLNRINVAVSRAKGLALVFGAPRLREARCESLEQMRLVNAVCALPELPAG